MWHITSWVIELKWKCYSVYNKVHYTNGCISSSKSHFPWGKNARKKTLRSFEINLIFHHFGCNTKLLFRIFQISLAISSQFIFFERFMTYLRDHKLRDFHRKVPFLSVRHISGGCCLPTLLSNLGTNGIFISFPFLFFKFNFCLFVYSFKLLLFCLFLILLNFF